MLLNSPNRLAAGDTTGAGAQVALRTAFGNAMRISAASRMNLIYNNAFPEDGGWLGLEEVTTYLPTSRAGLLARPLQLVQIGEIMGLQFASYYYAAGTDSIVNGASNVTLSIDTEEDPHGLATLAGNTVTINVPGWYLHTGIVEFTAGAALNGGVTIYTTPSPITRGIYATADAVIYDDLGLHPMLLKVLTTTPLTFKISNTSGQTLSAWVWELTIMKLGEL